MSLIRNHHNNTCSSYIMGCPSDRGDNPRALASGISYEQVDKHDITLITPTSV